VEGMIKGPMDGMEEPKGNVIFETINENLKISDVSDILIVSVFGLMVDALHQLRDLIKAGKVTWKVPFAQLNMTSPILTKNPEKKRFPS
jgi:hypothetical protein